MTPKVLRLVVLLASALLAWDSRCGALEQWAVHEIEFQAEQSCKNPFRDVLLTAEFVHPSSGTKLTVDLAKPGKWKVDRQGTFEAGFGSEVKMGRRRFHIPFVSMTAGAEGEFRQRQGDPATPERIAEWLRMSLQAYKDGTCDGLVTYCLEKRPQSRTLALAQKLLGEFKRDER